MCLTVQASYFKNSFWALAGLHSSVGIATRYELYVPGIESQCGRDIPQPSRPAPAAHPASYSMDTGAFQGVKRPGRGVDTPPSSSVPKS